MAVLRETARHVTRGLGVVGPQCVQARTASRDRSTAAEADHDEGTCSCTVGCTCFARKGT